MPCRRLTIEEFENRTQETTGHATIEDCEQSCCGDKPKCPQEPTGICCPEGEICLETYASGFPNPFTCCKPENICQGTDSSGYPFSACFGDEVECIIE